MFKPLSSHLRDHPQNSKGLKLPHISLFKDRILQKDFTHSKAGILALSEKIYALICTASQPTLSNSQANSHRLTLDKHPLLYENYEKKMEYYGTLTLKSENNYLKSCVTELEEDFQKVYKFNQEMVKANKTLETKLNTCHEKIDHFISYYQNIIDNVNTLFKKTENYLLSSYKLNHSSHNQMKPNISQNDMNPLLQPKLTFLFSKEVSELRKTFQDLQNKITQLNKENFDLEALALIESAIENRQTHRVTVDLENRSTIRQSIRQDNKPSDIDKDINAALQAGNEGCRTRFSVSNWWRTMEKTNKVPERASARPLNSTRKTKTPRNNSQERELGDSFLYGSRKLDESLLSHLNPNTVRKSVTPLKPSLKERIEEMLKPAINSNHTRHNSLLNSMYHQGNSTRCSSTKASIPSNIISPDANVKILDFMKDKTLSSIKNKDEHQTSAKQADPDNKLSYRQIEPAKPTKIADFRNRASTRLRINEILESKPNTNSSFNIPALNMNKIIPMKQEKKTEEIKSSKTQDSSTSIGQIQGNGPRFSSRETYDHLRSFRKPVKDLHVDLTVLNVTEKAGNKSFGHTRNLSSHRLKGNWNCK